MRIHVMSDLHLEFGEFTPPETNADVVILAGDIHLGTRGIEWAQRTFGDKPVIYIAGIRYGIPISFPRRFCRGSTMVSDSRIPSILSRGAS